VENKIGASYATIVSAIEDAGKTTPDLYQMALTAKYFWDKYNGTEDEMKALYNKNELLEKFINIIEAITIPD
jgi:hypothetical protein